MTDAHCHVSCGDPSIREFLIGRDFAGIHPWQTLPPDDCPQPETAGAVAALRARLAAEPALGVGEIGLDRLKRRDVSPQMRATFVGQLRLADEFRRPVVLHGAKCWGDVVRTIREAGCRQVPAFLFHGFSRSDGLLPDIVALNGFVSVGPAVLNDHAVNYRALVRKIPLDRLLVETDRTPENAASCPPVVAVAEKVAELRGLAYADLEKVLDENAARFNSRWLNLE